MAGGLEPECPVEVKLTHLRGSQMSSVIRRGELLPAQAKSALPQNAGHPGTKQLLTQFN